MNKTGHTSSDAVVEPPIAPSGPAPGSIKLGDARPGFHHCCFAGCTMVTCQCGGHYCVNIGRIFHVCQTDGA